MSVCSALAEGPEVTCQVTLTDRPRRVDPAGQIVRAPARALACEATSKPGVLTLLTVCISFVCRAWAVRSFPCAAATSQPTNSAGSSLEQAAAGHANGHSTSRRLRCALCAVVVLLWVRLEGSCWSWHWCGYV